MERIASSYYEVFKCIAGECPFTCCQQWRIATDDGGSMPLGKDGKCDNLTQDGLCSIQKQYGEEAIPETCRTFPRIDKFFDDRTEHTVTACCPAVVDLMNTKKLSFSGGLHVGPASHEEAQISVIRNQIIRLIMNEDYSCSDALMMSFYILLDFRDRFAKGHGDPICYDQKAFKAELAQKVDAVEIDALESMLEENETFRDLMSAYIAQGLYTEFLSKADSMAAEISECTDDEEMRKDIASFEGDFHRYDHLMRNYLANEIFVDLIWNDSDPVDMLIGMQWTAICYASIKQASFIFRKIKGRLDYEDIRGIITLTSRMSGYDECDIDEYLQEKYKSLIWEWGYFALLVGR